MATLSELIEDLQELEELYGDCPVLARVGSSGCTYELSSAFARGQDDIDDEMGPWDVTGNWIEIYAGNQMLSLLLFILGIIVYFWLGIQTARYIKADTDDVIPCIIAWPIVLVIGGILRFGEFLIKQVKG